MNAWPVVALAAPLVMLGACVSPWGRERIVPLLPLAPAPALLAALLFGLCPGGEPVRIPPGLFRVTLLLDGPGALLLGVASLLWIAAGAYAMDWLQDRPDRGRFAVWWLLTLTGSLGVFMAADLVSFYLMFALVSLPATGLVVFDETPQARRAAALYAALAVFGEAFLLLAFILLAQAAPGSLLITNAVAALPGSAAPNATIALLIVGFGLKIGLVPLHVWMPQTYTAAPIPAAAVLSGAGVKAGVIGLIRFLPYHVAIADWGTVLVCAGLFSAFYGVAIGITQTHCKTILAYSSVSQMGLIAAVLGMGLAHGGLAHGDGGIALIVAFYAAHHVLVKGGLFLAVGLAGRIAAPRRFWIVLLPASLVGLSLAGLPLTGGAVAKFAIKGPLGDGAVALLGKLSAAGTTLLMLHFLQRLGATAPVSDDTMTMSSRHMKWSWLGTAAAVVVLPWALYAPLGLGTWSDALAPAALWTALWPVLLGGVLAILLRWQADRLPRVPAGDLVVVLDRAAAKMPRIGDAAEGLDGFLRQWPVAGVSLLVLVVVLGVAMLAGK